MHDGETLDEYGALVLGAIETELYELLAQSAHGWGTLPGRRPGFGLAAIAASNYVQLQPWQPISAWMGSGCQLAADAYYFSQRVEETVNEMAVALFECQC